MLKTLTRSAFVVSSNSLPTKITSTRPISSHESFRPNLAIPNLRSTIKPIRTGNNHILADEEYFLILNHHELSNDQGLKGSIGWSSPGELYVVAHSDLSTVSVTKKTNRAASHGKAKKQDSQIAKRAFHSQSAEPKDQLK